MAGSRPTYEQTREAIRSGRTTTERVVADFLESAAKRSSLNAFLRIFDEGALAHAREVDDRIRSGQAGPLAGMVVAVKDNICIRGDRVTCRYSPLMRYRSISISVNL